MGASQVAGGPCSDVRFKCMVLERKQTINGKRSSSFLGTAVRGQPEPSVMARHSARAHVTRSGLPR